MEKIIITHNAWQQIQNLCKKTEYTEAVRLSIMSGGCHGFNKVWSMSSVQANLDDTIYESKTGGGTLLIDSYSLKLINGGIIDYVEDISGSQFTLSVPSAAGTCGCGASFSL